MLVYSNIPEFKIIYLFMVIVCVCVCFMGVLCVLCIYVVYVCVCAAYEYVGCVVCVCVCDVYMGLYVPCTDSEVKGKLCKGRDSLF